MDAFYSPLGFSFMGTIEQPQDLRGSSIGYLKDGDTVLEVFTYDAEKQPREPAAGRPGLIPRGAGCIIPFALRTDNAS
jgi:hypothetical protein